MKGVIKAMNKIVIIAALLATTIPSLSPAEELDQQDQSTNGNSPVEFIRIYAEHSRFGPDKSTHVSVANVPGTSFSVAYLQGYTWCGSGGCTLLVLKSRGSSYEVAGKVLTTWPPIVFLGVKDGGLPEIGVWVHGGGVLRGYEAALAPKGGKYPVSPSLSRRRVPAGGGTMLIGRDDGGIALFE